MQLMGYLPGIIMLVVAVIVWLSSCQSDGHWMNGDPQNNSEKFLQGRIKFSAYFDTALLIACIVLFIAYYQPHRLGLASIAFLFLLRIILAIANRKQEKSNLAPHISQRWDRSYKDFQLLEILVGISSAAGFILATYRLVTI